jgi:hypothetical protein
MNAPKIEYISSYQIQMTYPDGKTEVVALNEIGDAFGAITCPFPPCKAVSVEVGKEGFSGVYTPPQLVQNQIDKQKKRRERMLMSELIGGVYREEYPIFTNSTPTINIRNVSALNTTEHDLVNYERRRLQQLSEKGIKNPVYCIKASDSFMFSIPSPYNYPKYMRDSVLNSNPTFDYGQFLSLEQNMKRKQAKKDITPSTFSFTFTQSGTYVFFQSGDENNLMIITVKGKGETCSDSDRYI